MRVRRMIQVVNTGSRLRATVPCTNSCSDTTGDVRIEARLWGSFDGVWGDMIVQASFFNSGVI